MTIQKNLNGLLQVDPTFYEWVTQMEGTNNPIELDVHMDSTTQFRYWWKGRLHVGMHQNVLKGKSLPKQKLAFFLANFHHKRQEKKANMWLMGKKVPNRHISTKENLKSPYSSRSAGYKNIAGFLKFSMFLELIIKCFYVC